MQVTYCTNSCDLLSIDINILSKFVFIWKKKSKVVIVTGHRVEILFPLLFSILNSVLFQLVLQEKYEVCSRRQTIYSLALHKDWQPGETGSGSVQNKTFFHYLCSSLANALYVVKFLHKMKCKIDKLLFYWE